MLSLNYKNHKTLALDLLLKAKKIGRKLFLTKCAVYLLFSAKAAALKLEVGRKKKKHINVKLLIECYPV